MVDRVQPGIVEVRGREPPVIRVLAVVEVEPVLLVLLLQLMLPVMEVRELHHPFPDPR